MNQIRELEAENMAIKKQLELVARGDGGSANAQRVLDGTNKKVSFALKSPGFEMSTPLMAVENSDPNAQCTSG